MSKYQADIAITVSGAQELTRVTKLVNTLNTSVNTVNRLASVTVGGNLKVANVENYNKVLNTARRAMNNAAEGTKLQDNAITHYVTTLKNAEDAEIRLARAVKLRQKEMGMAPSPQVKPAGGRGGERRQKGGFLSQLSNPSSKLGSAVIGGGFPALMGGGPGHHTRWCFRRRSRRLCRFYCCFCYRSSL